MEIEMKYTILVLVNMQVLMKKKQSHFYFREVD